MITIPRHDGEPFDTNSGPWWTLWDGRVVVCCGNGHHADITDKWKIADDGSVTPSILCHGNARGSCGWHEFVRLEGWSPSDAPASPGGPKVSVGDPP